MVNHQGRSLLGVRKLVIQEVLSFLYLVNYEMKWKAVKLMNTDSFFDFWDKSDPYLKFLKIRSDNSFLEAVRSEIIKDNLNPSWRPVQIAANRLQQ